MVHQYVQVLAKGNGCSGTLLWFISELSHSQCGSVCCQLLNLSILHIELLFVMIVTSDCDTDHYLLVAEVRERLAVSKQTTHRVQSQEIKRGRG
jgi:hypothetical protein